MDPRISHLEAEVARLHMEVECMKAQMRFSRRDPRDLPMLLCYLILTGTLLAAMWAGFGWI